MATFFADGSIEFINTLDDVNRILHEKLGDEPAHDIMKVINRNLKEKDEEIDRWQKMAR